jgi:threonine dehydrogenase-like Zn-dependent dehydrogenase
MNAIVNTAPGTLEWLERPLPEPGPGQVRIRTGACGICATDLEMIAGWERTAFPAVPGHEWSGIVDAVGPGVDTALLQRRCVAENVWADGGEVGFEHPGGYAQYLLTEAANVQPLPADLPFATAALIEPLAVCVRAMRRLGEYPVHVLIFGDGPIGLLMTSLLARAGAEVSLVGGRARRLALAAEFGAQRTWNYHTTSDALVSQIGQSYPHGVAAIVEATGSVSALHSALELVGREGRVLVLGDYGHSRADFPWNFLLHREVMLLGSNASAGAWPLAVELAVTGQVPLERLVTHRLPAQEFQRGVDLTRRGGDEVIKVVLNWA